MSVHLSGAIKLVMIGALTWPVIFAGDSNNDRSKLAEWLTLKQSECSQVRTIRASRRKRTIEAKRGRSASLVIGAKRGGKVQCSFSLQHSSLSPILPANSNYPTSVPWVRNKTNNKRASPQLKILKILSRILPDHEPTSSSSSSPQGLPSLTISTGPKESDNR